MKHLYNYEIHTTENELRKNIGQLSDNFIVKIPVSNLDQLAYNPTHLFPMRVLSFADIGKMTTTKEDFYKVLDIAKSKYGLRPAEDKVPTIPQLSQAIRAAKIGNNTDYSRNPGRNDAKGWY